MKKRLATILLVDSNHETREALAEFLNGAGYVTVSDHSAEGALCRLRAGLVPVAMVVNQPLPGMTARELLRRCAHDARFARIPAVLVSGTTFATEDLGRASRVFFLREPVDEIDLLQLIRTLATSAATR